MKQPTRDDLWNLRYKYYALYESLNDKLPNQNEFSGSHNYIVSMVKIASERDVYAKVIQDIDKLLGV